MTVGEDGDVALVRVALLVGSVVGEEDGAVDPAEAIILRMPCVLGARQCGLHLAAEGDQFGEVRGSDVQSDVSDVDLRVDRAAERHVGLDRAA